MAPPEDAVSAQQLSHVVTGILDAVFRAEEAGRLPNQRPAAPVARPLVLPVAPPVAEPAGPAGPAEPAVAERARAAARRAAAELWDNWQAASGYAQD